MALKGNGAACQFPGSARWFVSYSAFRIRGSALPAAPVSVAALAIEAEKALAGVTLRAAYDLTGFRAEADLMLWLIAEEATALQAALRAFGASGLGSALELWWTAIGVHRPAEFNQQHLPAFLEGREPRGFVCVYPYTRTTEWYLLRPSSGRAFLVSMDAWGAITRAFKPILSPLSGWGITNGCWHSKPDDLTELTDLMRHLRAAGARAYTASELPFLTGTRTELLDLIGATLDRGSVDRSSA